MKYSTYKKNYYAVNKEQILANLKITQQKPEYKIERKIYQRKYYLANRKSYLEKRKLWRIKNKENISVHKKIYYRLNIKKIKKYNKERYQKKRKMILEKERLYRMKNKQKVRKRNKISSKKYNNRLKTECMHFYGGESPSCMCCGISDFEFLTIHHKNNDGAKERKKVWNMYLHALKQKNKNKYEVLCMNCNWAIGMSGYCPHSKNILSKSATQDSHK